MPVTFLVIYVLPIDRNDCWLSVQMMSSVLNDQSVVCPRALRKIRKNDSDFDIVIRVT